MISLPRQIMIVFCLSLVAAGAGYMIAGSQGLARLLKHGECRAQEPASGEETSAIAAEEISRRRQEYLAITTPEVLWQWISEYGSMGAFEADLNVLLEDRYVREGGAVWEKLLAEEDELKRERLTDRFLAMLALREPWVAFSLFQSAKRSFGDGWARDATIRITEAAYATSADKVIEVIEELRSRNSEQMITQEYAEDFDFQKIISRGPAFPFDLGRLPYNFIAQWGKASPKEAAEWIMANYQGPSTDELTASLSNAADGFNMQLQQIAESTAPGRDEALEILMKLPAEKLKASWSSITNNESGKIRPRTLDAATRMGFRELFLVKTLMKHQYDIETDNTWSLVPLDERLRTLDEIERLKRNEPPPPAGAKYWQDWRASVEKAWAGGR